MNSDTIITQDLGRQDHRGDGPQPIGDILSELLAQYQQRFPGIQIAVVEAPAGE